MLSDKEIRDRIGYELSLTEYLGFQHAVSKHEVPEDYLLSCLSDAKMKDATRMFLSLLRAEASKVEELVSNLRSTCDMLMSIADSGTVSERSIYSLVEMVKGCHYVLRYKLDNNMSLSVSDKEYLSKLLAVTPVKEFK